MIFKKNGFFEKIFLQAFLNRAGLKSSPIEKISELNNPNLQRGQRIVIILTHNLSKIRNPKSEIRNLPSSLNPYSTGCWFAGFYSQGDGACFIVLILVLLDVGLLEYEIFF